MTESVQLLSMMDMLLDPVGLGPGCGLCVSTQHYRGLKGSHPTVHRTHDQDQDQDQGQDQGGSQDHTGSEPPPEPASAETWSPKCSESPVAPQHSPEAVVGHGEHCGTAVEEEEEEEEEEGMMEEMEKRCRSGEDVRMSSPHRSSLEGKFSCY